MGKAVWSSMWKPLRAWGVLSVVAASLLVGAQAQARGPADGLHSVPLASLPAEARHTQRLIHAGGPFPYSKDGTVFGTAYVEVDNLTHLAKVTKAMLRVKGVQSVERREATTT